MDIISGLSAVRTALGVAKDLREIDKSVDEAAFKIKLAELTSALADAQVSLSDAKLKINELQNQIDALEQGQSCPICLIGRMRVESHRPDKSWPNREKHHLKCDADSCRYEAERTFDKQAFEYIR